MGREGAWVTMATAASKASRFELAPPRRFILPAILLLLSEARVCTPWFPCSRISHFGQIDRPAVYRALALLEHDRLVEASSQSPRGGQARRVYPVTPLGERVLREWMGVIKEEHDHLEHVLRRYRATGTTDAMLAEVGGAWASTLGSGWSAVSSTSVSWGRLRTALIDEDNLDTMGRSSMRARHGARGRPWLGGPRCPWHGASNPAGPTAHTWPLPRVRGGGQRSGRARPDDSTPPVRRCVPDRRHPCGRHQCAGGRRHSTRPHRAASARPRSPNQRNRRPSAPTLPTAAAPLGRADRGALDRGSAELRGNRGDRLESSSGRERGAVRAASAFCASRDRRERAERGNSIYNAELLRRIDAHRYPKASVELLDCMEVGPGARYSLKGELTFHGVSRPVGTVGLLASERGLVITGAQVFDIRDFAIPSPTVLMLRDLPDVRVRLHAEAELREEP